MPTSEYTALYVDVLLPLALQQEYTYRIPQEFNEEVAIGKRVVVQFGKKRIYTGIILAIRETSPEKYQAKYILTVLDDVPLVSQLQLDFWQWISSYYMCTLGEVMNAALPAGLKLASESRVVIVPEYDEELVLDANEIPIMEALKLAGSLSLDEIDVLTHRKGNFKYIQSLYDKGLVTVEEELLEKYKPKTVRYIRLTEAYRADQALKELFDSLESRSPLQLHVLMQLIQSDSKYEGVVKNDFIKGYKLSPSSVKTLTKNGVLEEYIQKVDRVVYTGKPVESVNELTNDQTGAYKKCTAYFEEDKTVLLHGITSSGKTHVYIKLIEDAISDGGQVLYLLPEISLTTQLIRRIQTYFGDKVMVHHSRFNTNEQHEIWMKFRSGEAQILIAPRSGVFMPFKNLNLVIVDEEHENTYKQNEPSPRYHARDTSIVLASLYSANVILGSATPSIESRYNAKIDKYGYVQLHGRYKGVQLPDFEVVDMVQVRKEKRLNGVFSSNLLDGIRTVLEAGEQAILFQNRKGYVPITECDVCSWTPKCTRCDITLTYYRYENRLRCHFCGYNIPPVSECPACKNTDLRMVGYGTERIESELSAIFPEARIQRLDYSTTRTKTAFENIITSFENRETDILIGTQMIAKGLDFEHLSLVGIVDADHALNFPDFRAFERSFQLFTQVSGRAGRRDKTGRVIIQTNQPGHRIIDDVVNYNYEDYYSNEIADRKRFRYPPFCRLIKITLKHKDKRVVDSAAAAMASLLVQQLDDHLLGPQEPHVSRIRNMYIQQMVVKIEPPIPLSGAKDFIQACSQKIKSLRQFSRVRILLDADPS